MTLVVVVLLLQPRMEALLLLLPSPPLSPYRVVSIMMKGPLYAPIHRKPHVRDPENGTLIFADPQALKACSQQRAVDLDLEARSKTHGARGGSFKGVMEWLYRGIV